MSNLQASPGRALDAEVAEKVLGWIWGEPIWVRDGEVRSRWLMPVHSLGKDHQRASDDTPKASNWYVLLPRVSTDQSLAMSLLSDWQDYDISRRNGWYTVELFKPSREYKAHAETLPEAICRARLKAVHQQPGDAAPSPEP